MSSKSVEIRMGSAAIPVGILRFDVSGARETSSFSYYDNWISGEKSFPLAPSMPFDEREFFNRSDGNASSLPGPLADATPDSWGRKVIKLLLGKSHLTELDFLIETDDILRSGALRIYDRPGKAGLPLAGLRGDGPRIPSLHDLSSVILQARDFDADPDEYARKRANMIAGNLLMDAVGSLGGARPKVNALDEAGDVWIVKLPKQNDRYSVERVEVMTLRLANEVGIRASESRIINTEASHPVSIIKRFDRATSRSGVMARIPYISAQSFLGMRGAEPGTYEEIATHLRTHGGYPDHDIPELFRRLMFTVLIRNSDDHLRNHGLLRYPGGWRLSPAFDINPSGAGEVHLKTAISEIHGAAISLESVLDASVLFDISRNDAEEMVGDMATTIKSKWRKIGHSVGMTARDFSAIRDVIENEDLKNACDLARKSDGPAFP